MAARIAVRHRSLPQALPARRASTISACTLPKTRSAIDAFEAQTTPGRNSPGSLRRTAADAVPTMKIARACPATASAPRSPPRSRRVIGWLATRQGLPLRARRAAWSAAAGYRRARRAADGRDDGDGARRPTPSCSARSAGRNGTRLPSTMRPERGLLRLRKEMGLFANLRPAAAVPSPWPRPRALKPRGGRGPRHDDPARAHRRRLFRRAARHRRHCRTASGAASTPRSITDARDRARRARRLRAARASAPASVCSVEKANVHGERRAVARGGRRACGGDYPGRGAGAIMFADNCAMQLVRCAEAVRRHRHRQPVRRHPVGCGRDADGLARHAALGLAGAPIRPAATGALRAGARHGARYRRQGPGQPAGRHAARLRDDAALLVRPGGSMRIVSKAPCGKVLAARPAYRRHRPAQHLKVSTTTMGDALLQATGWLLGGRPHSGIRRTFNLNLLFGGDPRPTSSGSTGPGFGEGALIRPPTSVRTGDGGTPAPGWAGRRAIEISCSSS